MFPLSTKTSSLEDAPLNQLIIHFSSDEDEAISFSEGEELTNLVARDVLLRKSNCNHVTIDLAVTTSLKHPYKAIEKGLEILTVSKGNWPCYRELTTSQEKLMGLCSFTHYLWLGGIPAVIFGGNALVRFYNERARLEKTAQLTEAVSQANREYQAFLEPYLGQLSKYEKAVRVENYTSGRYLCFTKNSNDNVTSSMLNCNLGWHSITMYLSSIYIENVIENIKSTISWHLGYVLDSGKGCSDADKQIILECFSKGLECLEENHKLALEKPQYIANHSSEKEGLEASLHTLQSELLSFEAKSSWDPFLWGFFGLACVLSFGYVLYLYLARKRAYADCTKDSHQLRECLNPKQIDAIEKLSIHLEIPFENLSVEELTAKFKSLKLQIQPEESLFWLFTFFRHNQHPIEICRLIYEHLRFLTAKKVA